MERCSRVRSSSIGIYQRSSLYARIWTVCRTASGVSAISRSPLRRSCQALRRQWMERLTLTRVGPITWTATGADAYRLTVGTSPGGNDVVNTGEASTTSYNTHNLPTNTPLYARIWTRHANVWRYGDAVFAVASHPAPVMIAPLDGDTAFDGGLPFQWKTVGAGARLPSGHRQAVWRKRCA